MYSTCRTSGVWRSLVARPLWERKAVGSNPATPTSADAFRGSGRLPAGRPRPVGFVVRVGWAAGDRVRGTAGYRVPDARAAPKGRRSAPINVKPQGDPTVKSAVETLNPTRVRLTVEVPFEELKPSLDAAYKKINNQVTVPGFRK